MERRGIAIAVLTITLMSLSGFLDKKRSFEHEYNVLFDARVEEFDLRLQNLNSAYNGHLSSYQKEDFYKAVRETYFPIHTAILSRASLTEAAQGQRDWLINELSDAVASGRTGDARLLIQQMEELSMKVAVSYQEDPVRASNMVMLTVDGLSDMIASDQGWTYEFTDELMLLEAMEEDLSIYKECLRLAEVAPVIRRFNELRIEMADDPMKDYTAPLASLRKDVLLQRKQQLSLQTLPSNGIRLPIDAYALNL